MFSRIKKAENHTHSDSQFMSSLGNFVSHQYIDTISLPMLRTCIYQTQVGGNTEYAAGISVDYGSSVFDVTMKKGEDGKVKFERPKFSEYIIHAAQVPITEQGGYSALTAIQKYIQENSGKKYGYFFGLGRNSNSFVRYVLKSTREAKPIANLYSPLTAKSAANKIDKFNLSNELKYKKSRSKKYQDLGTRASKERSRSSSSTLVLDDEDYSSGSSFGAFI